MSGDAVLKSTKSILSHSRKLNVLIDVILTFIAYYTAFVMRFDGVIPREYVHQLLITLPALVILRFGVSLGFGLDRMVWRYVSTWDVMRICQSTVIGTALFAAIVHLTYHIRVPLSIYPLDALLLITMRGGLRVMRRALHDLSMIPDGRRILIVGAGDAGEMIVRDMKHKEYYGYTPVGFVDDDPAKIGRRIHGVPVLGSRHEIEQIIKATAPEEVLIAMSRVPSAHIRDIVKGLEPYRLPIKILPSLRDVIDGTVTLERVRNVSLEDLLARPPVGLDGGAVRGLIENRAVMVTGAGGSIGSELCRQLLSLGPRELVMYERHENSLYAIENELRDVNRNAGLAPVVGDVCDGRRVAEVIASHRVDLIFHAAAHKHVPLMELNPCEAIKNNVGGTRVLLEEALASGVQGFVLISTDKAVNPSNVMGASKRVAEMMVQAAARRSGRRFVEVRFGNVLGSSGSVVPRFLEQIRKGGPITITDPEMRRFFMLIPEAVQLVLHASAHTEPGAVYVLEMGEQIPIVDMARHLIRLSGAIPDEDIRIEFTGVRPGEKLFEKLCADDEIAEPSQVNGIRKVRGGNGRDPDRLMAELKALEQAAAGGDYAAVRSLLKEMLPTFSPMGESQKQLRNANSVHESRQLATPHQPVRAAIEDNRINDEPVEVAMAEPLLSKA